MGRSRAGAASIAGTTPAPRNRIVHSIDSEDAPFVYRLLNILRDEHAARRQRGETFTLSVKSMERAQVIPGWSWRKYGTARDLLPIAGLIELVHGFVKLPMAGFLPNTSFARLVLWGARRGAVLVALIPRVRLGSVDCHCVRLLHLQQRAPRSEIRSDWCRKRLRRFSDPGRCRRTAATR